jgi:hypothetical protein
MSITTGTASMYARNVLTKLGVHSRLQAAALADREGLLRPAEGTPSSPGPSDVVIPPDGIDVPA